MNNKIIRIELLVLALFLVIGTVSASNCQGNFANTYFRVTSATWGNTTHAIAAGPGDNDTPLTVTILNYGNSCNLLNVEGFFELGGGITNFNGSSYSTYFISNLQAYSTTAMTFYVNIAKNVGVGPNAIVSYPLFISWNYTNSSTRATQIFNVSLPLHGRSDLSFSASPGLVTGKLYNLSIKVTNKGTGIGSGISTTISAPSGISIISQPQKIEMLKPNQSQNISVTLYASPSLSGQAISLGLDTHYINPYGYNTSLVSTLGMYALQATSPTVSVSVLNQTLVAGKIVSEDILFSNNGNLPITNVSATLTPESPLNIIGASNFVTVPLINAQASVSVPINLYVPTSTSQVSTLQVGVSYDQNPGISTWTLTFLNPGYINVTTVSSSIIPASPAPGQIFSIITTLNDVGVQAASSATVSAFPPNGITLVGSSTSFIGGIPVQTPTAFTLSFSTTALTKPGEYQIPVRLSYLNNLNQVQNSTLNLSVYISSAFAANAIGTIGAGNRNRSAGAANSFGTTYKQTSATGGSIRSIIFYAIVLIIVACLLFYSYKKGYLKLPSKQKKAH